ncbi:MAG: hypothetical protein ACHQ2Z_16150 [Elusimicrobiota bacterium]
MDAASDHLVIASAACGGGATGFVDSALKRAAPAASAAAIAAISQARSLRGLARVWLGKGI